MKQAKYHLYRLRGACPGTSVVDIIDYACNDTAAFLDRFFIEEIPEDELDVDDRAYLADLDEFDDRSL